MLRKALALACAMAGLAACLSCGSTESHYVYATLSSANQLIAYREDPNSGVLTQIAGSPYSVGDGAHSVVIHPSGKYLYEANPGQDENDIWQFSIASNGSLTVTGNPASVAPYASQPTILAMDPGGNYLYVMNSGSNNLSIFSIASGSGTLSQVPNSPFPIGCSPLNMQIAPSGSFLYLTCSSSTPTTLGLIVGYSLNSGQPTIIGTATSTDGLNPNGLAIDPTGTYLYVANTGSNTIAIFSMGSTGALTELSGSPFADIYNDPTALTLDPKGQYLFVANQSSNNVAVYSITNGVPTGLTTSTTTFAFTAESKPSFIMVDPGGNYLFVGNTGSPPGVQSFQISAGNLNPIYTYDTGNGATSIAVLQ
jgi:6-phosphogluconolactonase